MTKNTCELRTGRLLEIRIKGYDSVDDVNDMMRQLARIVENVPSSVKHVTVSDWRACKLLSEQTCEQVTRMFMSMNARTERSALLCSDSSPTAVWQLQRLIGNSDNNQRRLFTEPRELSAWLTDLLSPAERERLGTFMLAL